MNGDDLHRKIALAAIVLLLTATALGAAGCGTADSDSSTQAIVSPAPSPLPSATRSYGPMGQALWRRGTAGAAQTLSVATRYADALSREDMREVGRLQTGDATWDLWVSDSHTTGRKRMLRELTDAAADFGWSQGHLLAAPGVGAWEALLLKPGDKRFGAPCLQLVAVDGGKVSHVETLLATLPREEIAAEAGAPGPDDTTTSTGRAALAFIAAFAAGDGEALRGLVASDVTFTDASTAGTLLGPDALVGWRAAMIDTDFELRAPIVGRGWAVARWTAIRDVYDVHITSPGATVVEVRDGRVVRATLYYDSNDISLMP